MALRRLARRSSAALIAALLITATVSGSVAASREATSLPPASASSAPLDKALAKTFTHKRGTAGTRPSINVAQLAKKKPVARPIAHLPTLVRTPIEPSGPAPKVLAAAPDPVVATTNADAAAAQTGFDGLARNTSASTNGEPPDPWVAVGPEHVVQAVNLQLRMTNRLGGSPVDIDLATFFELPVSPVSFNSDPRVIYDSLHGRWVATEVSWDCETYGGALFGHGYIDIAISNTADPTGGWGLSFIAFDDALPDYPAAGMSADKVGFASNVFAMTQGPDCTTGLTFQGAELDIFDWTDLLNGGGSVYDFLVGSPAVFTPRIAVQAPAISSTLHAVYQLDNGVGGVDVAYLAFTGSVVANSLAVADFDLTSTGVVSGFLDPPQPVQEGPNSIGNAVDSRPTDAIAQGNRLIFVSTYPCAGPNDCVRVTELNTTNATTTGPTRTQDFLVAQSGKDLFMGGVGLSGDGTLHVGWTRTSTTAGDFPTSYAGHQELGDAFDSISTPEVLAAGTGVYTGERWGDYVGIAQDPQVPSKAWNANEYSGTGTLWKTKVTPLQTAGTTYVPIAPLRVLDTRVGTGLSGMFTSGNARSWQVTGVGTIPANAVAVTGNVTVVGQTSSGFVSVTVTSTNNPPSSTINFPVGDTRANNVTTALSPAGRLSATFKGATGKKTHLLFDVTGYFLADVTGGTFNPVTPYRALDTRTNVGLTGKFVSSQPRSLQITTLAGPIPLTATAITGNLTVVGPGKAGFASVTKTSTTTPATSTINFPAGAVRANGVFAPLDATGKLFIVYKSAAGATTHVLLDVTGYFEPGVLGLKFVPLNPSRIMDSRPGVPLSGVVGAFTSGTPKTLTVQGHWGAPPSAVAVTGNLTVTAQTASGFVSATPDPEPVPLTSTINFLVGDTMANGIVAPLNGTGQTSFVYKTSAGKTTHLILDLSGYFE
jgi:hypothetical protein